MDDDMVYDGMGYEKADAFTSYETNHVHEK